MARIRTIKPEFPQSESMGRISRDARLLFVQLWTICDDSGRARGASRMLASLLFPYDDDAPGLIDSWLAELERENCIWFYEVDGSRYLQVRNWLIHQKIDKPSGAKCPSPREDSRALARIREHSSEDRDRDHYLEEDPDPHTSPCSVLGGQNPEAATGRWVGSPSALVPNRKPHNPPASDSELRPLFDAYCRGSGQGLAWRVQAILPTEQIATHTRDPAEVERVASHYRATLTEGKPASLPRFAAEFDRWRAEADRKRGGGKAPKRDWAREGRCSLHPGEDVTSGPCELCAAQERARAKAREGAAA